MRRDVEVTGFAPEFHVREEGETGQRVCCKCPVVGRRQCEPAQRKQAPT